MDKRLQVLRWSRSYKKGMLAGDIAAGFTVAVLLVPQGMALAMLAGLPPIVGLYAAVVSLPFYAMFGSSRKMSVGPVAIISLLVASGISNMAVPGSEQYVFLAAALALIIGLLQLLMGLFRFGFLVNFLSQPVISGFTSAAAVIIAFSQLRNLLGLETPRTHYIHEIAIWTITHFQEANGPTTGIGLTSLVLLLALKKLKETFPRTLIVVVIGTLWVWAGDLELIGVAIMGKVPPGFREVILPHLNLRSIADLLPMAGAITLISYIESMAIAKKLAQENDDEVDPNQELIGLGMANIGAGFLGGYPVAGGFSRSAVNAQAGAQSPLSSIITSIVIAFTLLFLTPFFYYLPTTSLAAVVIMAVLGLIDYKEASYLYKVKRTDFISLCFTFVATLSLGIEKGILLSIVVSLVLIIKRTTNPHYAILGRLPRTKIYRNIERYPEAITLLGLIIVRVDASLYFANISFLKELITKIVADYKYHLSAIVFDASSLNDVDASADRALQEIAAHLKEKGIELYFTNVKGPVRDMFKRSGFYEVLTPQHFFFRNQDAVEYFLKNKP